MRLHVYYNQFPILLIPIVDSSNKPKWDIGWGQNLSFLQDGVAPELALTPCYFGKYPLVRILGSFYSFFDSQELDSLIDSFITPPYDIPRKQDSHP